MFERLSFKQNQLARQDALDLAKARAERRDELAYVTGLKWRIARHHPELGDRYLLPSGQTTADFEEAARIWAEV